MVPCHSFHMYGVWRSKEAREALKSSFGAVMQASLNDCFLFYALNFIIFDDFYEIFSNSCFLVYSSNFTKFSWTAVFKVNFELNG